MSENVGNFMMFKVLTNDTHKIIHHSNLRSARDPDAQNLRIDLLNANPPKVIHSLCKASPALDDAEELLPLSFDFPLLGEVTWTKDGCSKNLTRTRNVPPKCNKQVTTKQQTRFSLTSIN
jgi:hypothetical protein